MCAVSAVVLPIGEGARLKANCGLSGDAAVAVQLNTERLDRLIRGVLFRTLRDLSLRSRGLKSAPSANQSTSPRRTG